MGPGGWGVSGVLVAGAWLAGAVPVDAGAWPQPVGHSQLILKLEEERATVALDGGGSATAIPVQDLTTLNLYAEYGLRPDLTLQLVAGLERHRSADRILEGVSPCSAGLRYVFARWPGGYLSTYAGGTLPSVHDRTLRDPSARQVGGEVRVLAGQSLRVLGRDMFAEVQVARLIGAAHASQTRVDSTLGLQLRPRLMLLNQIYVGGQEGALLGASWVKLDHSLVRSVGTWRIQVGWRRTILGRNLPVTSGPIIGLWRQF